MRAFVFVYMRIYIYIVACKYMRICVWVFFAFSCAYVCIHMYASLWDFALFSYLYACLSLCCVSVCVCVLRACICERLCECVDVFQRTHNFLLACSFENFDHWNFTIIIFVTNSQHNFRRRCHNNCREKHKSETFMII